MQLRGLDRRRLSEVWFTWKLRMSLIKMNNKLIMEKYVLHFNAKATESILRQEFDRLRNFLTDTWLIEHENCENCESNCSSISEYF